MTTSGGYPPPNRPPTGSPSTMSRGSPTSSRLPTRTRPRIIPTARTSPVGCTEDIFEALDIQDDLQVLYTSGTVFHAFLGQKLPDWKAAANLVKKRAENYKLPYYTLSPTYSVCEDHGYITRRNLHLPSLRQVDRGLQPYNGLIPPRAELERRQAAGVQGPQDHNIDTRFPQEKRKKRRNFLRRARRAKSPPR